MDGTQLYARLMGRQQDPGGPELVDGLSEGEVADWLSELDLEELESSVREQITARTVGMTDDVNGYTLREIIVSHNDDPAAYDCGYYIDIDGHCIVQWFKRGVGGREPLGPNDQRAEMKDHVAEVVEQAVDQRILALAIAEFSV